MVETVLKRWIREEHGRGVFVVAQIGASPSAVAQWGAGHPVPRRWRAPLAQVVGVPEAALLDELGRCRIAS